MTTELTRYAGWKERWRARKRRNELERLIATSRHMIVAWRHELAHIKRTGRADWVNPNQPQVRPASDRFFPPTVQPVTLPGAPKVRVPSSISVVVKWP
jgi:hypothetical protein